MKAHPHPLGLPKGTVRATITLLLSIDLIILTLDKSALGDSLSTLVAVALTFYFGGKMRAIDQTLTPRGIEEINRGEHAFGLKPGSVRLVLILLFGGTFGYLYYTSSTIPSFLYEVINIVSGYLLGQIFNKIRRAIFPKDKEDKQKVSILDHFIALGVIIITSITLYLTLWDPTNYLTDNWILFAGVMLGFYFGRRSH